MSVIPPLRIVYQPLPGDLVTRFQAARRETEKQGCEQEVSSVIALKAAPRVAHRHLFLSLCLPPPAYVYLLYGLYQASQD